MKSNASVNCFLISIFYYIFINMFQPYSSSPFFFNKISFEGGRLSREDSMIVTGKSPTGLNYFCFRPSNLRKFNQELY